MGLHWSVLTRSAQTYEYTKSLFSPQDRDQFFAVGLVNYGFGCYENIPAVYVNLADSGVKDFIINEISDETC